MEAGEATSALWGSSTGVRGLCEADRGTTSASSSPRTSVPPRAGEWCCGERCTRGGRSGVDVGLCVVAAVAVVELTVEVVLVAAAGVEVAGVGATGVGVVDVVVEVTVEVTVEVVCP